MQAMASSIYSLSSKVLFIFFISSVCFFPKYGDVLIVSLDVQRLHETHISIIYFSDFCLIIVICLK